MLYNSDNIVFILSGENVLLNFIYKTYTIRRSSLLYTNFIRTLKDMYAFPELYNAISIFGKKFHQKSQINQHERS
jgi:hypothetical protein